MRMPESGYFKQKEPKSGRIRIDVSCERFLFIYLFIDITVIKSDKN